ncbi:MAG: glycosyltransferase family 4 protein [bacterium]
MLSNFFNNKSFTEKYDVSFSYRKTREYEEGFKNRVNNSQINILPLNLLNIKNLYDLFSRCPIWIQKLIKVIINLFMIRCFFVFYNTIVLYKIFKKKGIKVLHINNGGYPGAYSCMSAVFAAKLAHINNIVYVVNNIAVPYDNISRKLDYCFDKLVSQYVTLFVTGSLYAGNQLMKVLRIAESKVVNIHNGIGYRPITEDKAVVLKRLGIGTNKLLVGIVAIHEQRKGHLYLFEAIKKLKEKYGKKTPLLVVEGCGPLTPSLIGFVKGNNLEKDIVFVGNEKKVFNFMNAMDVIVLPSISNEDFPNVVLEAMSLGKIIVASKIAGIPEQIDNMKNGIIVEPRNVDDLVESLGKIIENIDTYKKLGLNAKDKFNDNFTDNVAVNRYDLLYKYILEGGNA